MRGLARSNGETWVGRRRDRVVRCLYSFWVNLGFGCSESFQVYTRCGIKGILIVRI